MIKLVLAVLVRAGLMIGPNTSAQTTTPQESAPHVISEEDLGLSSKRHSLPEKIAHCSEPAFDRPGSSKSVRSLGINGGVLCTDALESLKVFCSMKTAQRIGAHDVHVVRFD